MLDQQRLFLGAGTLTCTDRSPTTIVGGNFVGGGFRMPLASPPLHRSPFLWWCQHLPVFCHLLHSLYPHIFPFFIRLILQHACPVVAHTFCPRHSRKYNQTCITTKLSFQFEDEPSHLFFMLFPPWFLMDKFKPPSKFNIQFHPLTSFSTSRSFLFHLLSSHGPLLVPNLCHQDTTASLT